MTRILIVEDDPINAEVASIICEAAGYQIALATNGVEALEQLSTAAFDLVLTDVIMPRMDGVELTRRIRAADAPYARLPIVGLTAQAGHSDVAHMLEAGMTRVLTKPFRSRALSDLLDTLTSRPAEVPETQA